MQLLVSGSTEVCVWSEQAVVQLTQVFSPSWQSGLAIHFKHGIKTHSQIQKHIHNVSLLFFVVLAQLFFPFLNYKPIKKDLKFPFNLLSLVL